MGGKVVQDTDDEDEKSPTPSPAEAPKSCNGLIGSRARDGGYHSDCHDESSGKKRISRRQTSYYNFDNTSKESLKNKIDDIQKILLQNHSAQGCEDFICEEHQSGKGSLVSPLPKRRRLLHHSNASRHHSEDPYILLQESKRPSVDNNSNCVYGLAGIDFQAFSQPLTTKDAPDFEQIGDVESLGDGSSTIPYGSLTQRRLMDRVVADLESQKEAGKWSITGSKDIVEDDSLMLPLSSLCAQQDYPGGAARSPIFKSQPIVDVGHELLSLPKSSSQIMNTNLGASSKLAIPLDRKKRFETEPMHNTSRSKDGSDDELCFSAGILSAAPHNNSRSVNNARLSYSEKCKKRRDDEPDDINVHDHMPKCGLDQAQWDLPSECYIPRPTHSRSRPIKVEEIDYSQSPEKVARKQHRKGSSRKVKNITISDSPPLESDGSDTRDEEDCKPLIMKQKQFHECDRMKTKMPVSGKSASACSQDKVRAASKTKSKHLAEMGFCPLKAKEALRNQNGHMNRAIQQLLECSELEHEQTDLKIAGLQESSRKTLRRLRKGRNTVDNDILDEQYISTSEQESCTSEVERTPNRVVKTAHVEIFKSTENLSRDKACTEIITTSQETPFNPQNGSDNGDLSASNGQLSDHERSGNSSENVHLKDSEHRQSIENGVLDNREIEETEKLIDEPPKRKKRGRPRKRAKIESLNNIQIHEDPIIQAEDPIKKGPSARVNRSLTPIPDYNNNSIKTKDSEGCPLNATDDPKTPSSKSHAGTDSSPFTIEKSEKIQKQEHDSMPNHSPLSKSHVPYRVGLSRSAKIRPLLRSLKK